MILSALEALSSINDMLSGFSVRFARKFPESPQIEPSKNIALQYMPLLRYT